MPACTASDDATAARQLDEIQRSLRGLEEVESRLAALEKRVDELAKPKRIGEPLSTSTSKSSTSSRSAA